jgi:hypothetical protein
MRSDEAGIRELHEFFREMHGAFYIGSIPFRKENRRA